MGLYLGSSPVKLTINQANYGINLFCKNRIITNNPILQSSDGYALKDAQGLYITAQDKIITSNPMLLSFDNFILKDNKGLYLTAKEI